MAETDTASTRADGGVRSIARAVEVLELFDVEHPIRTLRELVALTGLPKTTVVRLLATLDSLGLILDRGDSGRPSGVVRVREGRLAACHLRTRHGRARSRR